jgi:hypothetical protein
MQLLKHTDKDVVSSTDQRKPLLSHKMTLLSFCALFLIVSAALISVNLSSTQKAHAATLPASSFTQKAHAATQDEGDFTQKTITASPSQAQISFTPNGWTPGYVIVHFLYANSGPQNANMTYDSASGSWQYTINNVNLETFIYYSFTYEKDGVQYDSGQYTYLF